MILFDFLREFLVSFWDTKAIVKSGIGVIELKATNLFEDVKGVCDIEKSTQEVTMSSTGVLKKFSWWWISKRL